jgi:meso-butanediol dehydrogenase / (S,S)-butanediol dehydrogenase / diacetyl reductase
VQCTLGWAAAQPGNPGPSVVLVTGGGTGIGIAISDAFVNAGAHVVVTGRQREPLNALVATNPERVIAVPADMSVGTEVKRVVEETIQRHGRLDIVVSNPAAFVPGDLTDLSDEDWATMRSLNVNGFFHLAKAVVPHLQRSKGTLLAESSVSGLAGDWGQAGYDANKGAVSNFVRSLALDWGTRGVRVNAVAPALTDTVPVQALTGNSELRAQFENRVALGVEASTCAAVSAARDRSVGSFCDSGTPRHLTNGTLARLGDDQAVGRFVGPPRWTEPPASARQNTRAARAWRSPRPCPRPELNQFQ